MSSVLAPHTSSPAEIKERLEAERSGRPHAIHRDAAGGQIVTWLDGDHATVGRREDATISLAWDGSVSRLHAELHRVQDVWMLVDDGLSRNGSSVNGTRVIGRRRLEDGDVLTFGSTSVVFRAGGHRAHAELTQSVRSIVPTATVSAAERCVLVALCRPLHDGQPVPATNRQIADELCLSVPAVKRRLGSLFERFGLELLPQNEKRASLAAEALRSGIVRPFDF